MFDQLLLSHEEVDKSGNLSTGNFIFDVHKEERPWLQDFVKDDGWWLLEPHAEGTIPLTNENIDKIVDFFNQFRT